MLGIDRLLLARTLFKVFSVKADFFFKILVLEVERSTKIGLDCFLELSLAVYGYQWEITDQKLLLVV